MIDPALDWSPLWISLKIAGLATVLTFFAGLTSARLMLEYRNKFRGLIDTLLISPLVLPPTVVGFLLLLLLGKNSWVGQLLNQWGITVIFTWQAAVVSAVVVSFPLMYRTTLGAFEQIDRDLLAAARTLGHSEWSIFWLVMIPLAYRGIVGGTILAFARALGEFGATLMLAGNIPGQTQTLPLAIFFATESGDYETAGVWVAILLLISLSIIITVNFWAESSQKPSGSFLNLFLWKLAQKIAHISQNLTHPLNERQGDYVSPNFEGLSLEIEKTLANFNLRISLEGDRQPLGLLGASGSGKSMTLRCIAGLEAPDRGRILVNGAVWFDAQRRVNLPPCRRRVGFVFQNYALFPHLTAYQNIAFGVQNLPRSEQRRRVELKLAQMRLQDLAHRYPSQLSGGQQQRVALARALAIEPEILLLDEPFSALDSPLRTQMEKNLLETLSIYPGVVLMVSHNLEELYRICQNILVVSAGQVLSYGDKEQIFQNPQIYEVARLTGCKNFSPIIYFNPQQIWATDWHCPLTLSRSLSPQTTQVGIRAHHLRLRELETGSRISPPPSTPPELEFTEDGLAALSSPSPEVLAQNSINEFPCWLAQKSETPHRVTLYLKLHQPPEHDQDYHLQMELFKENWRVLSQRPQPWRLFLDPERLLPLE
ncbi:MAG: molybdate ABC transporter permease subunit [Cyanobacteria bacterium RI_101]|nr:molybdate ABC transporter permease subunit [Cyanobacteria bacterium RI_101]